MTDFEKIYVSVNNASSAPSFDPVFFSSLRNQLYVGDDSIRPISYPLLAALAIGAHRPDVVLKLFEEYISDENNEASIQNAVDQFKGVLMIVWPFVGIPWCVPACLGLVNALKSRGLEHLAEGRKCPDIGPEDFVAGQALLKKTYAGVQNNEVRDMLRTYFSDFSALTWAVVFGYSLAGTTKTGIFMEENTQLILAASITSSGATRQARSHLKASLGLGHSMATVRNVHQVASTLADWNGTAIAPLDVAQIAAEVKEALATAESQKSVA